MKEEIFTLNFYLYFSENLRLFKLSILIFEIMGVRKRWEAWEKRAPSL